MANGVGGFLVSAGIVAAGLAGLWVWPTLQTGGIAAVLARLDPGADMAMIVPPDNSGAGRLPRQAVSESLPPARIAPISRRAAPPPVPETCRQAGADPDAAVPGDRIALRLFETSVLAGPPGPGDAPPLTDIVFERLDLSGIYAVGPSGALSLPALGHVEVAGRMLACIEAQVAGAAFDRLGAPFMVSAAFDSRPPVLVRGAVRAPGAHGYSPGLTVERLLAVAGALDQRDPAAQVRLIALQARRTELDRTRASLALERLGLEAALEGRDSLPGNDPALVAARDLLGPDRVARETAALTAQLQAEQLRRTRTEATLADLATRIEAARRQREVADTQLSYYAARREQQTRMLRDGFITDSRLDETAMRAMDAERIYLEKDDLLFRLQAEHRLARHDADLAGSERLRALTTDLRDLSTALDAADSARDSVLAELGLFAGDEVPLEVTIAHAGAASGSGAVAAGPGTRVRPGDLVTISAAGAMPDKEAALPRPGAGPGAPIQSAWRE